MKQHECLECGLPITGKRAGALFCSPAHRKAWNNRRAIRGAELYDLVMTWRYDREEDKAMLTLIGNMARAYRDSDNHRRAGRRSWDKGAYKRLSLGFSDKGDGR